MEIRGLNVRTAKGNGKHQYIGVWPHAELDRRGAYAWGWGSVLQGRRLEPAVAGVELVAGSGQGTDRKGRVDPVGRAAI